MEFFLNNSLFKCSNCQHENCLLSALKGLRNGMYYGGKVRFVHSLVMTILFKNGTMKDKIKNIIEPTIEHSMNLGLFVFIYKSVVCILKKLFNSDTKLFNFISGLIGAYFMWYKKTNVNMQIMLYLLSRNLLAISKIVNQKYIKVFNNCFGIASMITWGIVMFLYEYKPKELQQSLFSSMEFIYTESDKFNNWLDLVPFYIPDFIKKFIIDK